VVFGEPNGRIPSPPELVQYLISSRFQAIAQMDRVVASRSVSVQRLGAIDFTISGSPYVRRSGAPMSIIPDEARTGPKRCNLCYAGNDR